MVINIRVIYAVIKWEKMMESKTKEAIIKLLLSIVIFIVLFINTLFINDRILNNILFGAVSMNLMNSLIEKICDTY